MGGGAPTGTYTIDRDIQRAHHYMMNTVSDMYNLYQGLEPIVPPSMDVIPPANYVYGHPSIPVEDLANPLDPDISRSFNARTYIEHLEDLLVDIPDQLRAFLVDENGENVFEDAAGLLSLMHAVLDGIVAKADDEFQHAEDLVRGTSPGYTDGESYISYDYGRQEIAKEMSGFLAPHSVELVSSLIQLDDQRELNLQIYLKELGYTYGLSQLINALAAFNAILSNGESLIKQAYLKEATALDITNIISSFERARLQLKSSLVERYYTWHLKSVATEVERIFDDFLAPVRVYDGWAELMASIAGASTVGKTGGKNVAAGAVGGLISGAMAGIGGGAPGIIIGGLAGLASGLLS